MQLIVLGMHRSGTSVLARLLNLMGAYFGPEGASTGANSENPKGFWERRDVRNLNDAVLHSVDCDWNRIAKFDEKALPAETVASFNQGASRLVLDMDAHRPWLLKEPRLCLLFGLWRKRLEAPVCIHIYRSPVEVASSLHKRNGIPIDVGLMLWEGYVRSALRASTDLPQVVVSHRQLIKDPKTAVAQLHEKFVGIGVQGLRLPSDRELSAFVNEQFYREREGREDLKSYARAPQLDLFRSLLETGQAREETKEERSKRQALLEKFEAGLPPIKRSVGGGVTETMEGLRSQLALSEQQARFARELCSKYEDEIKRRDEWRTDIERERTSAREEIAKLEFSLADRDARLALERSDTAVLRETIGRFRAEVAQRDERVRAAESEITTLHTRLAVSESEVASLRVELGASTTEMEILKKAADSARAELSAAADAAVAGHARFEEMELALAKAVEDAMSLRSSLQLREESAESAGRALRAENTAMHGQVQMLAAQVASLKTSLLESHQTAENDRMERMRAEGVLSDCRHELVELTRLTMDKERLVGMLHGELDAARLLHHELESRLHDSLRTSMTQKLLDVARLDQLQRRVQGIERSLPWRITAPLRRLRTMLGKSEKTSAANWQLALLTGSELFDQTWYLAANPDVATSGMAAAEHYLLFGAAEGRNPGPDFDSHAYLHRNPDVLAAGMNPLVHFLTHGQTEGRSLR